MSTVASESAVSSQRLEAALFRPRPERSGSDESFERMLEEAGPSNESTPAVDEPAPVRTARRDELPTEAPTEPPTRPAATTEARPQQSASTDDAVNPADHDQDADGATDTDGAAMTGAAAVLAIEQLVTAQPTPVPPIDPATLNPVAAAVPVSDGTVAPVDTNAQSQRISTTAAAGATAPPVPVATPAPTTAPTPTVEPAQPEAEAAPAPAVAAAPDETPKPAEVAPAPKPVAAADQPAQPAQATAEPDQALPPAVASTARPEAPSVGTEDDVVTQTAAAAASPQPREAGANDSVRATGRTAPRGTSAARAQAEAGSSETESSETPKPVHAAGDAHAGRSVHGVDGEAPKGGRGAQADQPAAATRAAAAEPGAAASTTAPSPAQSAPAPDLSQTFGLFAAASPVGAGASAAGVTPASSAPAVPISGLAVEIIAQARDGKNRFEIRLDPPELGRIDVHLAVDRDGNVSSRLVVDRSETLDLLRRDAPTLERALENAGLKTAQQGLEFSLRDQGGRHQPYASEAGTTRLIAAEVDPSSAAAISSGYGRWLGMGGGVDIRV